MIVHEDKIMCACWGHDDDCSICRGRGWVEPDPREERDAYATLTPRRATG